MILAEANEFVQPNDPCPTFKYKFSRPLTTPIKGVELKRYGRKDDHSLTFEISPYPEKHSLIFLCKKLRFFLEILASNLPISTVPATLKILPMREYTILF